MEQLRKELSDDDKFIIDNSFIKSELNYVISLYNSKEWFPINKIPLIFKPLFNTYFFGKTLGCDEKGEKFAYPNDMEKWIEYLTDKLKNYASQL